MLSFIQYIDGVDLDESLIIINQGAKYGQIVFMAGGMASGKGFTGDYFLDIHKFKIIDPDQLKRLFLRSAILKKAHPELANLDLKSPKDATTLHDFVKSAEWEEQLIANLLKNKSAASNHLPNLLFDASFKNLNRFHEYSKLTKEVGYTAQNTHLIWVLTNYEIAVTNNRNRSRIAPDDLHLESHEGAAETMYKIVNGDIPEGLDGAIYVILNNPTETIMWNVNGKQYDGKEAKIVVDKFKYIQLKKPGEEPIGKAELTKTIYDWIYNAIPRTHKTQNVFDDLAKRSL